MKPTIYLSNHSSHRTPGMHGPGMRWSIMAAPRAWEVGDGVINCLTPDVADLRAVQSGAIEFEEYRARYEAKIIRRHSGSSMLGPGYLYSGRRELRGPMEYGCVRDGDSLCCACSKAEAAVGRCHRVWLAPLLAVAGWSVVLDGVPMSDDTAEALWNEAWERFVTVGRAASLDALSVAAAVGDA